MPYFGSLGVLVIENGEIQCDILTSTQDLVELPTPYYNFDIFVIDSVFRPFFGKTVRFNDLCETFVLNADTMREHILPHLAAKYRNGYENREAYTQYSLEWLKLYPNNPFPFEVEEANDTSETAMCSPQAQKRIRLKELLDKINYYSEKSLWYPSSPNVTDMTNVKPPYILNIHKQLLIIQSLDDHDEYAETILRSTYNNIHAQLKFTIIPTCKDNNLSFYIDALRALDSIM